MSTIITFFTGFLACVSPTISFVGVNTTWFNSKQIIGAILISLFLGICVGIGILSLPQWTAGMLAGLVFGAMSERMFASFLPNAWGTILLIIFIGVVCGL